MEKITITKKGDQLEVDCGKISMETVLTMYSNAIGGFISKIAKDRTSALSILATVATNAQKVIEEKVE